jgi:hypothetical protein
MNTLLAAVFRRVGNPRQPLPIAFRFDSFIRVPSSGAITGVIQFECQSHFSLFYGRQSYGKRKRLTDTRPPLILSDCSGGCKSYHTLSGPASLDWGICGNPQSHRVGLFTFEHQGCVVFEQE